MVTAQHARAQHRRQRQRDEAGQDDRDRDGHREFAEHAADHAAHQQHRDEHRDQREGDRDDGEADFARALERRLERPHAALDVADDVFQHDDGVVDDEADRKRQRQQRHVVDREIERVHRRAGRDQRNRHRERRNDGGRGRAQEQEDHQDDEAMAIASVSCTSCTASRIEIERSSSASMLIDGRNLGAEVRQPGLHRVDDLDGVGVGLPLDRQHDRAGVVEPTRDLVVFDAVDDVGDLAQPDRRAIAPGGDDVCVVRSPPHRARCRGG